jgi:hypothetical protein
VRKKVEFGFCVLLLLLISALQAQTQLSEFHYYWDSGSWNQAESISLGGSEFEELTTQISLTNLSDGFHYFHYRVKDTAGKWSLPETRVFWVDAFQPTAEIIAAEYFVDTDPGCGNAAPIDISAGEFSDFFTAIESDALPPGYHNVQMRVKNSLGNWSLPTIRNVFKYEDQQFSWVDNLEFFVDVDPGMGNGNIVYVAGGTDIDEAFEITLDDVGPGFHYLGMRAQTNLGKWSLPNWRMLFRTSSPELDDIVSINWYFTGQGVSESESHLQWISNPSVHVEINPALPLMHLQQGNSYFLHVFAASESGKKSHEIVIPFTVNWIPQNLQGSTENNQFIFSWDPIMGATSYEVYSGLYPDQDFQYAGSTQTTIWSEAVADHKFFQIRAVRD